VFVRNETQQQIPHRAFGEVRNDRNLGAAYNLKSHCTENGAGLPQVPLSQLFVSFNGCARKGLQVTDYITLKFDS
jgi:hypothetical protein